MEAGTLAIARPVASPLHRYWRTFVFAALFIVLWFGFLEVRGLYFPDEGRYAEIPREMLATGDWITPRVNEFPYFEKPPLQYWMTAAMFAVAGEDEWTARFPAALAGVVGILAVLATARRLYGRRAGWMAGAVLASFCGFFLGGQFLTLDMLLTTLLTCALCAFVLAQDARATAKDRRQWMLVAWALCGLAFLTKGAIAVVLPGLALAVYVALSRDLGLVRRLHLLPGLAVFAAITMPWFIAVELRNPGFNEFFFVHEHWQRFTQPVHRRTGPLWYFIPIAIVFLLPWLPAIVAMLAKRPVVRARSAGFDAQRFAWCWAATIFVFFSLSSSKLPAYIMPALGAVALAAAPLLARRWKASLSISGWTLIACGIFAAAATVAAPAWIKVPDVLATFESNRGWLFAAAAALAGTGVAVLVSLRQQRRVRALAGLVLGGMLACQVGVVLAHKIDTYFSAEHLIESLTGGESHGPFRPDVPFYSVDMFDHTVPFYLGRTVILVKEKGELAYGIAAAPANYIAEIETFAERWRDGGQAFAIMRPETFATLRDEGLPMHVVGRDGRRMLVSRQSPAR